MQGDRWRQVDRIFHDLIEQTPEQRASFLDGLCADDPSLKKEVEELIRAYERSGSFLDSRAPASASGSLVGRTLGSFEVKALIGSGGMGEVYRAWDLKLKREVAIKTLPGEFARDADRLRRFQREAEVLASLNHPNIAAVHDLEETNGTRYLVLELVEGETLADRLRRGPIPIEEALEIARQIAEGVEAAHQKDITHRDLKPANIKITPDDKVKVLDFGLAKALTGETPGDVSPDSPTMLSGSPTEPNVILGTAAYMSPEQARGKVADERSDIWGFGCVLYEMLTGKPAFGGESMVEIIGSVLKVEPDWSLLPANTPEAISRLLRRCLQKDHKLRLRSAGDACIEIEDARRRSPDDGWSARATSLRKERIAWISALVLVATIAVVGSWRALRFIAPTHEMRLEISTPPTREPASMAISPDGQKIVFIAASEGRSQLWLRSMDSLAARPLTDVAPNGQTFPFWSPDSRSVAFVMDGKLKRIDIAGGSVRVLVPHLTGLVLGGAWNGRGEILFGQGASGPIVYIPPTGGEPVPVTRLEPQQVSHRFPQFLADGRHFIYYVTGSPETRGVYIGQIGVSDTRRLFDADSAAVYAPTGQLLFVRQGTLFAQNFDESTSTLRGDPYPVAEQVVVGGTAALSASAAGSIAYRSGSMGSEQRQLTWFDRSGKELEKVGGPEVAVSPALSPDGRRLALSRQVDRIINIWSLEMGRDALSRVTTGSGEDFFAVWSPDGRRIAYSSQRHGVYFVYQKATTGESEEEILQSTEPTLSQDWSPDGRFLAYDQFDSKTKYDI
jgi:serine/threonine protein kinase